MTNMVDWTLDYVIPVYDEEHPDAKKHIALQRGPLMLAIDSQFGYDVESIFDICISEDGYVETKVPDTDLISYPHILELIVPLKNKDGFRVTEYGAAGKLWGEGSKIAAWIRTS